MASNPHNIDFDTFIKNQTNIYEKLVNHIQSQHPNLDVKSVNQLACLYIQRKLRQDPLSLVNMVRRKPKMLGNEKASSSIVIDICPKDIAMSDFLNYTNVKEYVRKVASPKLDLSEAQIELFVAHLYEQRFLKMKKWPDEIVFLEDRTVRTIDDFKRLKIEIEQKKNTTEAKLSIPSLENLAIDVSSTSRNSTETQSQLLDSTHSVVVSNSTPSEKTVTNTSAKETNYSSKSKSDQISILPKDISFEDFKQLTNIEHLMRSDIFTKYPDQTTLYLKKMDKHIRKYYESQFVKLSVWPSKILFNDRSIRTLEDIQRLKCQKLEGVKEQVTLSIEASTTKDIEREDTLDKPKKSVLKSKSKPDRHTTADKVKTIEEPIEMGADLNLSPELFPSRNVTEDGENIATLTSQANKAFVFCDIHNVSKMPNATHVGSQTCNPLSLGSADLSRANVPDSISLDDLSSPGQCETSIPDKTDNILLTKDSRKDEKDSLDDFGTPGGETIIPDKTDNTLFRKDSINDENNSSDSDDSKITEIFQWTPAKRKAEAVTLNSSEITLDTKSIKAKQEEENVLNEPLTVVTDTELQVLRTPIESMVTEVKDDVVTAEINNSSVTDIHDSTSAISARQCLEDVCRSNASPDYVKSAEEIPTEVTEKVDVQTESDSLVTTERDVTTQARESENHSENILAPNSSESKSNRIKPLSSSCVKNKTAVENKPVKPSVEEITSKSHSHPASRNSDFRSGTKLDTTENQSEIYTNIAPTAAGECVRVLKPVGRVVTNPVSQNINEKCRSGNNIENVSFERNEDRKNKEKDFIFKIPQTLTKHGKNSRKECKKALIEQVNSDKITHTANLNPSNFEKNTNVLRKPTVTAGECVRVLKTVGRVVTNPVTQNINQKCRSANNIENVSFERNEDRKNKEKDIIFKIPQTLTKNAKNSRKECKKALIEQVNSDKITHTANLNPSSFKKNTNVLRKPTVTAFSSSSKCAKKSKKDNETSNLQEIIVTQAKHNFQPLPLVSKFKNGKLITNKIAKRKATGQPATQHKKRKLSNIDPDYFIEDSSQASLDLSEIRIDNNKNEPTTSASSPSLKTTNTKSCKTVINFRFWDYLEEVAKFNNYIMKPCFTDLKAHFSHMSTITLGSIPNALVSSINYTSTFALLNCPAKMRFQSKTLLVRDDSYNFEIFQSSLRFAVSINASNEKDLLEFLAAIKSCGPQGCCSSPIQAASIRALQTILSRFKYFTLIYIQEKVKCHDGIVSSSASVIPNSKSLNTTGTALMYKNLEFLNN